MWESKKVNPAITYKNELGPKKQTITQELEMTNTPKGPIIDAYNTS